MCWIFPTFSVVISDMHRFHVLVAEKRDLEEFSELQEIKQENQNEGWIWHHGANWILQAWFGLKLSIISFSGGHVVPYFSLCLLRKQNVSTFLSVWLRTDAALEKSFASVCNLVVLPCCFLLRVKVYWEFVTISKRVLFQLRDFIKNSLWLVIARRCTLCSLMDLLRCDESGKANIRSELNFHAMSDRNKPSNC